MRTGHQIRKAANPSEADREGPLAHGRDRHGGRQRRHCEVWGPHREDRTIGRRGDQISSPLALRLASEHNIGTR